MSSFGTQPDPSLPLYLMNPPAGGGLPSGFQCGWWVTSPSPWPAVPVTLAQSWSGSATGVYLFLNATPTSATDFAAGLTTLLSSAPFRGARFLWIANPNDPLQSWQVQALAATQPGGVVGPTALLTFRNYALTVGAGAQLAVDAGGDGFTLTAASGVSLAFSVDEGPSFALTTTYGGGASANLPLSGGTLGCLSFGLPVGAQEFFDALDVGLRYFVDDKNFPGVLSSLRYPIFSGLPQTQTLAATFDPINPLAPLRTFLGFPTASAPAQATFFRDAFGQQVTLAAAASTFTPYAPSLVFAVNQNREPANPEAPYYLAPAGSFALGVPPSTVAATGLFFAPTARLMCGTAGLEYLGLMGASGFLLHFFPGQPAYAPLDGSAALRDHAHTSWLFSTGTSAVTYFAQPNDAALYGNGPSPSPYLQFLEVPSGTLKTSDFPIGETAAFPMAPYAGVSAAPLERYRTVENLALSPARRERLVKLSTQPEVPPVPPPLMPVDPQAVAPQPILPIDPPIAGTSGVTPQGLFIGLNSERTVWEVVQLAKLGAQSLLVHEVTGRFRDALQSNQLFCVLRDAREVMRCCELEYQITDAVLADLTALSAPAAVISALRPLVRTLYENNTTFQTALRPALGTTYYADWGPPTTKLAAKFDLTIERWRFRLSPTLWNAHADNPTILIFKYANRRLDELAADPGAWAWPEAAGDRDAARAALAKILDDAAASVDASRDRPNDLDYFVRTVMRDPSWNGILFLNANVPITTLPEELSGLAAGIDAEKFFAHHLGLALTPVQAKSGELSLGDSALFGLVRYDDPEDLYFKGALYDFKVQSLNVQFRNSSIVNFSSRVELMTNGWFGDRGDLVASERNNNLILDGSYQHQGGQASYVYEQQGSSRFVMRSKILSEVEIAKAQFTTVIPPEGAAAAPSAARFLLWGTLRFRALDGFDLFSFGDTVDEEGVPIESGGLRFSGLAIDVATKDGKSALGFNAHGVSFDRAGSSARPESLYANFPLAIPTLVVGRADARPGDLGYQAVKTPLRAGALGDEWYGLAFGLDLGALGALAGQLGFVVSLLAAWAPSENSVNAQVGLSLPGGKSLTSLIPIQGVVQLGFSGVDLTASSDERGTAYLMKLKKFLLQVLGLSFPPGQVDLFLFTNPDRRDRSALGWYGVYQDEA